MHWDLTKIFKDTKEFYQAIETLNQKVNELEAYQNKEYDAISLYDLLEEVCRIKEQAHNILLYGSLRYYENIKDEECIKLKQVGEETSNHTDQALKFHEQIIVDLGYNQINKFYQDEPRLTKYNHYLHNIIRLKEHVPDEETNKKITNLKNQLSKYINEYQQLLTSTEFGTITVDDEEVTLTLKNIAKYLNHRNRLIRSQATQIVNDKALEQAPTFANLLNNIFKCRIEISNLLGYESVLAKELSEDNLDSSMLDAVISSVHYNASIMVEYLQLKANLLGIDNPHLYDFGVSINSIKKDFPLEEFPHTINEALKPLGNQYLEVINNLLEGHFIDATPTDIKHPTIIFSWDTFAFINYKDRDFDFVKLAHEMGHIANYYLSMTNEPFIYQDSTIFTGENASLVNEIMANRYCYEQSDNLDERKYYLTKGIETFFIYVHKQALYTELEMALYKLACKEDLTVENITTVYKQIVQKYYGDNIIKDANYEYEWVRMEKIYRWSYYGYRYTTGYLMANLIINNLLSGKLSIDDYLTFLSRGSDDYSLELLKTIGIDLTNTNLLDDGFNIVKEDVKKLKKLISQKENK